MIKINREAAFGDDGDDDVDITAIMENPDGHDWLPDDAGTVPNEELVRQYCREELAPDIAKDIETMITTFRGWFDMFMRVLLEEEGVEPDEI